MAQLSETKEKTVGAEKSYMISLPMERVSWPQRKERSSLSSRAMSIGKGDRAAGNLLHGPAG
jgi:hypothetical protein